MKKPPRQAAFCGRTGPAKILQEVSVRRQSRVSRHKLPVHIARQRIYYHWVASPVLFRRHNPQIFHPIVCVDSVNVVYLIAVRDFPNECLRYQPVYQKQFARLFPGAPVSKMHVLVRPLPRTFCTAFVRTKFHDAFGHWYYAAVLASAQSSHGPNPAQVTYVIHSFIANNRLPDF